MTIIDPNTNIGKIRLRTGDWTDMPILPDSVIEATLTETNGNLPKAASICAYYILATLTSSSHRKMNQLEVWGKERFDNYVKFIQMTITNPSLAMLAPIPYSASSEANPIVDFQATWNRNFYSGTETQQSNATASYSPNDGSKFGPFEGF